MKDISLHDNGFEAVFRASKDGLGIFREGIFFDCNQSMLDLVGIADKEQFIGLTPFDFSPEYQPDGQVSAEKGAKLIERCMEEGSLRFEWLHSKFSGEPFWAEVIITKMMMNDEVVVHANWRDISEKKNLELEIAAQKDAFETLFNESVDGLCLLTSEHYLDCNRAFLDLLGFSKKEDIIGLTPMDISPEYQPGGRPSEEAAVEIIENAFNKGSVRFEWVHKKACGSEFWCEIIVTRITLGGGDVLYAITRDISEKKALELQIVERNAALKDSNASLETMINDLKQTQDKLIESEKMASLGSLVAGVAHEINTPVGIGLTGVTQLMEECTDIRQRYDKGSLTENDFEDFLNSANEIADIVKKNLVRTAHLVRSFKQVAVDQTSEEDREVNLKQYFDEVVFSLASVLRKASVVVDIHCPDNLNVITNPGLLSQVLTNLIVNSVNHGFSERDSGHIAMTLSELNSHEFLLVYKDNGKGISEENAPKIFDPFFTTRRGTGGTGLGLNITYNIVTNALGGSIKCRSKEGEGVEFTIQFKVTDRLL